MADPVKAAVDESRHDGRFGQRFDEEVSVKGVLWTTLALAVVCALGMWITWEMRASSEARAAATAPRPSPIPEANEPRTPPGPLLQRDPEGELAALSHEMSERLSGYGWVDEGAGVVHIPIERAMDLLLERGVGPAEAADSATGAASEEASP